MELYKSRGFSAFFQDTFTFLKQEGKHFFKAYFIINGLFLLILSILGYFFSQFYSDVIFSNFNNESNTTNFDSYLNENLVLFILLAVLFVIIALAASLVSYAFPLLYLKQYAEKGSSGFSAADIIKSYKKNIGKLITFIFSSILVFIILIIPLFITGFLLVITIIGMLLLPVLLGAVMLFYTMTLMEYLNGQRGIWDSFSYSFTLLKSNFWPAVGSVGLFYLISYVVQNVLTLIPYLFGLFSMFTVMDQNTNNPENVGNTMMVMILAVFFISFIIGAILASIVQLNQGIIYYSLKENTENINAKSIIDQIGESE